MNNFPDFSNYGYQVTRELGHNRAGGRVTYLATEINTKRSVVVKQFQFAQTGANWAEYQAYEKEIQILRTLDNPNIPRYLDSFQTASGFCMVQEYKNANSLATSPQQTPQKTKQIAISVLEILKYLQNRVPPVIHRDLKPENILVDDRLNVSLVDFGFARIGGGRSGCQQRCQRHFGLYAARTNVQSAANSRIRFIQSRRHANLLANRHQFYRSWQLDGRYGTD